MIVSDSCDPNTSNDFRALEEMDVTISKIHMFFYLTKHSALIHICWCSAFRKQLFALQSAAHKGRHLAGELCWQSFPTLPSRDQFPKNSPMTLLHAVMNFNPPCPCCRHCILASIQFVYFICH